MYVEIRLLVAARDTDVGLRFCNWFTEELATASGEIFPAHQVLLRLHRSDNVVTRDLGIYIGWENIS